MLERIAVQKDVDGFHLYYVDKPMALMLMPQDATVCICHKKTRDLAEFTRLADILVADGHLVDDVDFEGVSRKASLISPVPDGVGPMTITMLLHNTIASAKRSVSVKSVN